VKCSVDGCATEAWNGPLCPRHLYAQRHGVPVGMNPLLEALVAKVVANELTPVDALVSAWDSGIREGMARQRVAEALRTPDGCPEHAAGVAEPTFWTCGCRRGPDPVPAGLPAPPQCDVHRRGLVNLAFFACGCRYYGAVVE
jgi:hypothetical protein